MPAGTDSTARSFSCESSAFFGGGWASRFAVFSTARSRQIDRSCAPNVFSTGWEPRTIDSSAGKRKIFDLNEWIMKRNQKTNDSFFEKSFTSILTYGEWVIGKTYFRCNFVSEEPYRRDWVLCHPNFYFFFLFQTQRGQLNRQTENLFSLKLQTKTQKIQI